ncbi:MAG: class I SAM-dependent methyltransferase [Actinobacteria bacterium]|nr:MAG: class I SAM-dependent methyltransferase [Actinomycetota bacterium]
MPPTEDYTRFERLSYDDFRRLALDESLSPHEQVGFPNSYREGKEDTIFADITAKLPALLRPEQHVVEIGPGCSRLPHLLIELCRRMESPLVLVDSPEMLGRLPEDALVRKEAGRFPAEVSLDELAGKVDVVLVYSVLHYVFEHEDLTAFLERSLALLAPGGSMLLGDIPNASKRRRFFTSDAGVASHRRFAGDDSSPPAQLTEVEPGKIDDDVVLSIVARARADGFDAYVLPQRDDLPMANRREDILIARP